MQTHIKIINAINPVADMNTIPTSRFHFSKRVQASPINKAVVAGITPKNITAYFMGVGIILQEAIKHTEKKKYPEMT